VKCSKGPEMKKGVIGVLAGLVVWVAVGTAGGLVLRATWPEYVTAAPMMKFTLAMRVARLSIGAFATLAMGWAIGVIARSSTPTLVAGVLLLVAFIPVHVALWDKFPVWYHLTFLLSLVPLAYTGGKIAQWRSTYVPARADAA
jgi:hypothetical protein